MPALGKPTIPHKLLVEAVPHQVSVELRSGEVYRGKLVSVESSMNCLLETVTHIRKDGSTASLEQVYLRGAQIKLFTLPEMLRHARILQVGGKKAATGAGRGRGKTVAGSSRTG